MNISKLFSSVVLLGLVAPAAFATISLKVDNLKDGDSISGDRTFRVMVDSDHLITNVEFYVGKNLRDTDNSTPYEFTVDTLNEKEGEYEVTFAAYNTEGESAKQAFKIKVDNNLGKGVKYFIEKGQDALTLSKWLDAIQFGRTALKIEPNSSDARAVMARAYFGKGEMDQAQTFLEAVIAKEPNNMDALDLLSGINLQKTFGMLARSTNRKDTVAALRASITKAAETRLKVYETRLDRMGAVTPVNVTAYSDLAIRAGRYSLATIGLEDAFRKDERNTAVANRLIYAQMRAGRFQAMGNTLRMVLKRGKPDAYTFALAAINAQRTGDETSSKEFERQALLNDASAMGVKTTQAYLALVRNRPSDLAKIVRGFGDDGAGMPEALYYQSTSAYVNNDFEGSRKPFEQAILAEPAAADVYVQRANQAVAFSQNEGIEQKDAEYQRDIARVFYEGALAAKPESFEAFTGLTLLNLNENKVSEAIKTGRLATKVGPEYAGGYYTLSLALSLEAQKTQRAYEEAVANRNRARDNRLPDDEKRYAEQVTKLKQAFDDLSRETDLALKSAQKYDAAELGGASVPLISRAFTYFQRYGRAPLISLPN